MLGSNPNRPSMFRQTWKEGAEGESAGALHKSKVDYSQLSFVQKRLRKLSITSLCFGALTQKRWERAGGSLLLTTQVNSVQHAFRAIGACPP